MKKQRILVIEDDEEMCEELLEILKNEGYAVCCAYEGTTGMGYIRRDGYNVVLLDLKIPGTNSHKILKHLKSLTPAPKVLVITGNPLVGESLEMADGVINKPFDVDEMLSKIKELAAVA